MAFCKFSVTERKLTWQMSRGVWTKKGVKLYRIIIFGGNRTWN